MELLRFSIDSILKSSKRESNSEGRTDVTSYSDVSVLSGTNSYLFTDEKYITQVNRTERQRIKTPFDNNRILPSDKIVDTEKTIPPSRAVECHRNQKNSAFERNVRLQEHHVTSGSDARFVKASGIVDGETSGSDGQRSFPPEKIQLSDGCNIRPSTSDGFSGKVKMRTEKRFDHSGKLLSHVTHSHRSSAAFTNGDENTTSHRVDEDDIRDVRIDCKSSSWSDACSPTGSDVMEDIIIDDADLNDDDACNKSDDIANLKTKGVLPEYICHQRLADGNVKLH